ncbi:hypothetical protein GCM10020369_80290 [Cryptosporangium minutisporangium]|uniref:Uncharacterized protein n=1 Tax=Cryptosporangium minutisporangium TaxID=113569 RepID=A0ABP6TDI6_9ACTN
MAARLGAGRRPAAARRPDTAGSVADDYLTRRLDALAAGDLRVTVHHSDLLALPPGAARSTEATS